MAIPVDCYVYMNGFQGGERCVNLFHYVSDTASNVLYSQQVAQAFKTQVWDEIKDVLHQDFYLTSIWARVFQVPPNPSRPAYTLIVGEYGTYGTGDILPPHVTARLMKSPDNSTKEPTTTDDFRVGFAGISGIPEEYQDNGVIDATSLASLNAAFENAEEIVVDLVGGGTKTLSMGMRRVPAEGGVFPKVFVAELQFSNLLGTRNTRKRRG